VVRLFVISFSKWQLTTALSYCTVFLYHLWEGIMLKTTYTNARANFAGLCDQVTKNREIVVIDRRSGESVAMIAADELESLVETAHLMRSPKNAQRLLASLERALNRQGEVSTPVELRKEIGLEG
jgi:antitoxin YefM